MVFRLVHILSFVIVFAGFLVAPGAARADCTDPNATIGVIYYNSSYDVYMGCTANKNWVAFHDIGCPAGDGCPSGPQNCSNIGDTCDDGSIYAGLSPDGNVAMYTTPADAPSTYTWNDGTSNWVDTAMVNCTDASPGTASSCQTGEANTTLLVGLNGSGTPAPYAAAEYCDGLSAHGYDDWYLPAQDELNLLYTNKNTGDLNGTFNETGSLPAGWYWSSSESFNTIARVQRFSDGVQDDGIKSSGYSVRCVRR